MKENCNIKLLTKEFCLKNIEKILEIIKLIPDVEYKKEDILAEKKGDRILYGKWEHSLVLLDEKNVVGVLIAYEREKEKDGLYNEPCFYINEVAISRKYKGKGLGKTLLQFFIEKTNKYSYLNGNIRIRIQTTNSEKNKKVIELYKEVGFKKIGLKHYPLKEDIVLEIIK